MAQCGAQPKTSLGFMSRTRVRDHQWHRPRLSRHAFLEIHPADADFTVFGVHLSAVHAAWTERRRAFELGNLLRTIRAHDRGFHLLAGDFNTLAPGDVLDFRKLPARLRALVWLSGGRIRWRTIQIVLNEGYVDVFRRLHPDERGSSFPVWDPHVRLDYVFASVGHAEPDPGVPRRHPSGGASRVGSFPAVCGGRPAARGSRGIYNRLLPRTTRSSSERCPTAGTP